MSQLHCYLPDELAKQFQQKAKQAHLSVSKYLALLVKKELENQWPEDYFDLFGGWQGSPLERPQQDSLPKGKKPTCNCCNVFSNH